MAVEAIISSRDGEEILHVARRFWLTMLPQLLVIALLLLAPFFFALPLLELRPWGSYLLLILLFAGIFLSVRMLVQWYFTMFVVTSLRVVDVYHSGLFDRQVTDAGHEVIQDVSFRKKGLGSMLFNVGSIRIQTSGSNTMIEVLGVRDPGVVLGLINEARRTIRTAKPVDSRKKVTKVLDEMDEEEVREVLKVAQEKKRSKAAKSFFEEVEDDR